MPGIVNNAVPETDPDALTAGTAKTKDPLAPATGTTATAADPNVTAQTTSKGYDPTNVNVTDNQTVAGQLNKDLAAGSPLIDKARAGAMETANQRGLQNSSMAAGAGESAAIGAMLPVAAQDASTFAGAATRNANAADTAGQFNAGAENTASQVNAGIVAQQQSIKQSGVQQQTLAQLQGEIETGLQTLKGSQSVDLANIESNYKQLMQANSSAATVFNESMQQIATILRDPATSAAQKSSAVDNVNALLNSSLAVVGAISNLDLGGLLDFSGGTPKPA